MLLFLQHAKYQKATAASLCDKLQACHSMIFYIGPSCCCCAPRKVIGCAGGEDTRLLRAKERNGQVQGVFEVVGRRQLPPQDGQCPNGQGMLRVDAKVACAQVSAVLACVLV